MSKIIHAVCNKTSIGKSALEMYEWRIMQAINIC